MGISFKILSITLICSLLIHNGHSSPIASPQILKSNGSDGSSMGTVKPSSSLITISGTTLKGINKNASKTEPTTNRPLQKKGLNNTTDEKFKNVNAVDSNKTMNTTNIGKGPLKMLRTEQLNKSNLSSVSPAVKDDKDKKNGENKDRMETKLDSKNTTGKNVDENLKSTKSQTLEKPKQIINNKYKQKENQTSNANTDNVYKINDDDTKGKQLDKPDYLSLSDKKASDSDKYDDNEYKDDEGETKLQTSSTMKQQKGGSTNVQQTYLSNKPAKINDDANSHFFAYLITVMVMAVLFYLLFHNKQRIIALMIEGRGSRPSRRGSARAKYHKLDNNLEEAMGSMRSGGNGSSTLSNVY